MKELLNRMNERLKYLESEQAQIDGMDETEIKWRSREIILAIIATQEEVIKTIKQ